MSTSKSLKTAFWLSLFLGCFGADRWYLGYYASAFFKMITLGGLGVAYTVDLILIAFGYLGPADGTVFPERVEWLPDSFF
jgi:TM2 domain-containing membrane protein YozV